MLKLHSPAIGLQSLPVRTIFRTILAVAFIAAGIYLPFAKLPLTDPWQDEFYQALNVRGFDRSPIAMLSFFICHEWCGFFGDTLYNIRVLTVLFLLLSNGLGCLYFYSRTRDGLAGAFLFMTVCAMSTHCTLYHYGWDIGAYPFIVMTLLATLYYVEKGTVSGVVLVGGSTALMVLARIPTLVIMPVLSGIIIWRNCKAGGTAGSVVRPVLRDSFAGILSFAIVAIIVVETTVGIGRYVSSWTSENIITGHSGIRPYIDGILSHIAEELGMWAIVALMALAAMAVAHLKSGRYSVILKCSIFIAAFLVSAVLVKMMNLPFLFGIATGTLWIMLLYIPVRNVIRGPKIPCPGSFLWIVFCFAMLAGVGSDSILERPLACPLIPVVAAELYKFRSGMLRWFLLLVSVLILKINVGALRILAHRNVYTIDQPRLEGLYLSAYGYEFISSMKAVSDSVTAEGKSMGYLGLYKDYHYYMFTDKYTCLIQLYHYDENNPKHLEIAVRELKDEDVVGIRWDSRWDFNTYGPTSRELEKYGFETRKIAEDYLLLTRRPSD